MTWSELLVRGLIASVCIGLPAAILGQMVYVGRHIGKRWLATIGAAAGFAAPFALLAGLPRWWAPTLLLAAVMATTSALLFFYLPELHKRARRN